MSLFFSLAISTVCSPLHALAACLVGIPGGAKVKGARRRAGQLVVHVEVRPETFLVELEGVDAWRKKKQKEKKKREARAYNDFFFLWRL